jgi:F0F1-type ATP synthase epsilon subunit
MTLEIICSSGYYKKMEVNEVKVLLTDGWAGIRDHHSPMIAILDKGALWASYQGKEYSWELEPALLEMKDNVLTVLADLNPR